MSKLTHYPMGTFSNQKVAMSVLVPSTFKAGKKYLYIVLGHGQGEAEKNLEDLNSVLNTYNWGGWGNIKLWVDKYDIIIIWINTRITSKYNNREYQNAAAWAEQNLPVDENQLWIAGHSLGWYGIGNFVLSDAEFAKKVNGTIDSSSGPYSNSTIFKNIANNGIKVFGAVALNDTVVAKTNLVPYTQQLYSRVKILNPSLHPLIVSFPATTWPDPITAHNAVISRITGEWTGITQSMFMDNEMKGDPKMSLAEWMLSNPRGSIYQNMDGPYIGPRFIEEIPIPETTTSTTSTTTTTLPPETTSTTTTTTTTAKPRVLKGYNIYGDNLRIQPVYTDGSGVPLPVVKGDEVTMVWTENINNVQIVKNKSGRQKLQ